MKGLLSQFEGRVSEIVNSTYKPYKQDFVNIIGYLPSEKRIIKKKKQISKNDFLHGVIKE